MKSHRHQHGYRLSRRQRVATYVAFAGAWTSGALWLLFHYFMQRQGEFAFEPHPLEQWWLRLHGLSAFVLLWLGGVLWALHVRHGLGWPRRRPSGLAVVAAFCVLAVSGYLIYYADEGATRDVVVVLHWVVGLGLILPVVLHTLPSIRARRSLDVDERSRDAMREPV